MLRARWATDRAKAPAAAMSGAEGEPPGLGHVGGEDRERPPTGGESDVVVDDATEELEVVAHDEEGADDEEGNQRRPHLDDPGDPEGDGTAHADPATATSTPTGDPGAQRPPVQLVECVGGQADGEEEGQQGGDHPGQVHVGARQAPMTT